MLDRRAALLILPALLLAAGVACRRDSNQAEHRRELRLPSVIVSTGMVRDGDSIAMILRRHAFPIPLITGIERTLNTKFNVRRMRAGHQYEVLTSTNGEIEGFRYITDPTSDYTVRVKPSHEYEVEQSTRETYAKVSRLTLTVNEHIYRDLLRAGYSETFVANLVSELADRIFAWRIDFFTEQRPGDRLDVLYEQRFVSGTNEPLRSIRVLAGSYEGVSTRSKENWAYRYELPGTQAPDYYDEKGQALRKAFLRAPFTHGVFHVSSGFTGKRLHPILRRYTAHHGIDYAAARGTPVAAIGNGTVIHAGWKGGYGNTIEIRHSPKYVSRYGHLSKIAVRHGQGLRQGQYIGNVGSTGLSTGPHLHFELLVDGNKSNFLRMSFPPAAAVPANHMADFEQNRDRLLERWRVTPSTPIVAHSTSTATR